MEHRLPQTTGLLTFIRHINYQGNDIITRNILDDNLSFVSKYYTPHLHLSTLASKLLDDINNGRVPVSEFDVNKNNIVKNIDKTSIKRQAPRIYLIIQSIILEAYSIVNCFYENPKAMEYLTSEDISKARDNIDYVCDYLGDFDDYITVVDDLRALDINFGYIQKHLKLIKGED